MDTTTTTATPAPTYIAITLHYWGKGATIDEAKRQCARAGGREHMRSTRYGFIVVETDDPNFEIHDIDGSVMVHEGKTAKVVVDKRHPSQRRTT